MIVRVDSWGSQALGTVSPKTGKGYAQPYGDRSYARHMPIISVRAEVPITEPITEKAHTWGQEA